MKLFLILIALVSATSHASKRSTANTTTTELPPSTTGDYGIGVAFHSGPAGSSSLSGLCRRTNRFYEVNLALAAGTPLSVGAGGIARFVVAGDMQRGLHLGAGLNLGTTGGSFYLNVLPVWGFHFNLGEANKNILVHIDGALNLGLTPAVTATLGPMGGLVASIHWML